MAQTASGDSQTRDSFTSRTAFIIACIGSAVGLSGIWLFPYRVSQLGGAAFLIPYLFFVVLLGLTGVVGEMSFGRAMGCGPMGAFGKALELRGMPHATRIGKVIGIVPVLAALGIAIGYTVVLGWFLKYLFAAATGTLLTQPDMGGYFSQITGDFGSIGWHAAALIITLADFCLAIACNVNEQPTVSVSNTIEFLSAAKGDKLIAECNVDKSGRKLGFYTVDVSDNTGRKVARMTATCYR